MYVCGHVCVVCVHMSVHVRISIFLSVSLGGYVNSCVPECACRVLQATGSKDSKQGGHNIFRCSQNPQ